MTEVNKSQSIRDYFKMNPKAKNQEVVDALGKKGVTVTANLVANVKTTHNKAQADKRAAKGHVATARNGEVNKTQAVRDYLKANKNAKNSEVVEALAQQGIAVTTKYISTIKAKHKMKRQVVKKAVAKGQIGVPEIKSALAFIKSIGSIGAAKQALEVAQEIRSIV